MKERVDPYLDQFACENDHRNMMISNEQYTKRSSKNIDLIKKAMDNKGIIGADTEITKTFLSPKKPSMNPIKCEISSKRNILYDKSVQCNGFGKFMAYVYECFGIDLVDFESMNEEVEC